MISLNNHWQFSEKWSDAFLNGEDTDVTEVRLPHTVKEIPLHYADDKSYQMISGYRKKVLIPQEAKDKRIFLQFDAAAHIATVYVNKKEMCTHECGYTAFRVEITDEVKAGEECDVAVRLDSTENPAIPPFGYVIDYLTYGGIYRPVWLDIEEKEYISDLFIYTPKKDTAHLQITVDGDETQEKEITIRSQSGDVVYSNKTNDNDLTIKVPSAQVWDIDHPYLYECEVKLNNGSSKTVRFGFRTIKFKADGFYLNKKRLVMRGLDRHQCYPYVGYAVSDSLQVEDARILKEELSCNAVRTSHYPQSHAFLDTCDEMGLLVFTEIPGWQHVGDEGWKDVACKNTEEMVLQYRNHPSIVLWGVRINESQDDDPFYTRTNEIAHRLDPSRPTSGVRYLQKSSLLEDVYAYNDFSHTGDNAGARKKKDVTPDMNKALLISEANGHMFPTKAFDKSSIRQDHALRHAKVMDAAMGSHEHAGVFQWCMFDYATHKDFGSGDRVCYHGVMDTFRNPKLAAYIYAMQEERNEVLEVTSSMDIGDYPAGILGDFYVLSNADSVKLYKNGAFVKEYSRSKFRHLNHGPVKVDDLIGQLLVENEGFNKTKAKDVHDCLQILKENNAINLNKLHQGKIYLTMKKYDMTIEDFTELYGKYVGNWGGEATVWRFDGIRNGKVVSSKTKTPSANLHLDVRTNTDTLKEGDSYDMAAVRIRILDEYDNIAPYAQLPVSYEVSGDLELVGPNVSVAEGGMTGTYLKTTGKTGKGSLRIHADGMEDAVLEYTIV